MEIKAQRITSEAKLHNIHRELQTLRLAWEGTDYPAIEQLPEWGGLLRVNGDLWNVEDDLRLLEGQQQFDEEFIRLARSVYFLNDKRASLKKSINTSLGSTLVEEKSYQDYGTGKGNSPLE